MATSSIPAAIDYLVSTTRARPAYAAPVVVSDGWTPQRGNVGLVVGITPEDPDTGNAPVWAEVGARAQWEHYQIPCILWAHVGGADMKTARDQAFALYDDLDTLLRSDPTLGGALRSGTAIIANVRISQTGTAAQAGEGRACEIRFDIACKSRSTA